MPGDPPIRYAAPLPAKFTATAYVAVAGTNKRDTGTNKRDTDGYSLARINVTRLFPPVRYERQHGSVGGAVEFLQIVIRDPWFAWIRPISEIIVQIDEFTASKEPTDPKDGEALLAQARELLIPSETGDDFRRAYYRAVQESPNVAMMHGEWKRSK